MRLFACVSLILATGAVAGVLAPAGTARSANPGDGCLVVTKGYSPTYGARNIKRAIQKHVEDPLSEELLRLKHGPGDQVLVEVAEDEVKMRLVPKGARRERKEKAEAAAGAPTGTAASE